MAKNGFGVVQGQGKGKGAGTGTGSEPDPAKAKREETDRIIRIYDNGPPNAAYFNVPAKNKHDHSKRIQFYCTSALNLMMLRLVDSKRFPFIRKGDFCRFAIHHTVQFLQRVDPELDITTVQAQAELVNDMLQEEETNAQFTRTFERMSSVIQGHLGRGAEGEARRVVRQALDHIERMPEDSYWRDVYLKEVDTRWGYLLKGAPTMDMMSASTSMRGGEDSD